MEPENSSEIAEAVASMKGHRTFCQFWVECWKDAWSHSWAWAGIMNLVLSIIIPFAAMLDPRVVQHQAQWTWVNLYLVAIGTVAVAWSILLARLLIWAPYDTVKKIEAKNKADLGVIKQRFDQFRSVLDDKLAKAEAQHNIADRIVMGREVLKLLGKPDEFLKAADEWNQDTELFLANNLGGYASVYFSIPHSLGPVDLSDHVKAGRQLILAKIIALDDIAANIDTYYRPVGVKFDKLQDNEEKPMW